MRTVYKVLHRNSATYKIIEDEIEAKDYASKAGGIAAPVLKAQYDLIICCRAIVRSTGDDTILWSKKAYEQEVDLSKKNYTLQHPLIQSRLKKGGYELVDTQKTMGRILYKYRKEDAALPATHPPTPAPVNPVTGNPAPMLHGYIPHGIRIG